MQAMTGPQLRDAFLSGANHIANNRQLVDSLNVFPVPDGDTGTNMSMTIGAATRELEKLGDDATAAQVSKTAAGAFLRGARGNSGVILSLLFRGFSKGLTGKDSAGPQDIAEALASGVQAAYKAVMKPTEGTILTVARMASEHLGELDLEGMDVVAVWEEILSCAKSALEKTPDMLPVLKKAGVVDAGGQGLVIIFEGMLSFLRDGVIIQPQENGSQTPEIRATSEELEEAITFAYCTEFLVKKGGKSADSLALRAYLESIGDSVVVVGDEDVVKCHVHTDNPGKALEEGLRYGQLTGVKIENMLEQFEAKHGKPASQKDNLFPYQPVDPSVEYGFVAVAAGEGIQQLFLDLGVNNVVSGGQTMNPSTEELLSAIQATPAKRVFVLPNNKNIIMAAEQTVNLADRKVYVLPTRTIPQGLSAMLAFDPNLDRKENQLNMTKALERVGTGQITFAARDSEFGGQQIKQGELLALENNKLSFTEKDITKAAVRLASALAKKHGSKDGVFVTLIYGQDVTEAEAQAIQQAIQDKLGENAEIALINGGQPVYYYMISVE